MPRWKLILEYDGTRYSGWQEQKNSQTVAGELSRVAAKVLGPGIELDGAGRTDAGVHALHQVARLKGQRSLPAEALRRALNDALPKDINILRVQELKGAFDPRRDAVRRYYLYQISTRRTAFAKKYVWWIKEPLDLTAMTAAADTLIGRHDFERFCEKRNDEPSNIVVVERVEIATEGDLVLFRIAASHFLWRLVRRIVGTLVEVALHHLTAEDFQMLLQSPALSPQMKRYSVAAHTAPPSGLFLERVLYKGAEEPGKLVPAFPVLSS